MGTIWKRVVRVAILSNSGWEIFAFQSVKSMKVFIKKYLLVVLLTACIAPSVASAAWWNPLSWKIFQKREVPVQEIVKNSSEDDQALKIEDLQKQIDDLKKSNTVPKNIILPAVVPVQVIQKPLIVVPVIPKKTVEDINAETEKKVQLEEQARIDQNKKVEPQKEIAPENTKKQQFKEDEEKKLHILNEKVDALTEKYDHVYAEIERNEIGAMQSGVDVRLDVLHTKYVNDLKSLNDQIQQVELYYHPNMYGNAHCGGMNCLQVNA